MNATVNQMLTIQYDQVDRGIYVWGGNGERLDTMRDPIEWINRHESDAKDAARAVKLYKQRVANGITEIRAFDCSGLEYWTLKQLGLLKDDLSSRGLYDKCIKITKQELRPGDLVFHHDGKRIVHVGTWAENGYQVECRGRDVGVVCNKRKAGYWNRFGRWPGLEPGPEPEPKSTVYVKGKSVNVRNVDHVPEKMPEKKTSILGVAHRGETYRLLGYGESGWYQIDFHGLVGYISNRSDLTELR